MPRVKIDYVVSFSDEDPENQASNLLSWEVSKKRWLCRATAPESSCSVVLQLARAVKISSLQIGVYHAALVEVLVGRSETPNEPYQVLVPRSVFVSPRESRGAAAVERVRSFSGEALGAAAAEQRWDRVRLVCSQPYNNHCMYGISFIQVFEPEGEAPVSAPAAAAPATAPAVPPRMLMLETFSSDDEEFSPGELFAKHRQSTGDTGAQIRQATSRALNNNSEAATKLVKTSLSKHRPSPSPAPSPAPAPASTPARDKDNLLYTKDDEQPHAKIDHIVQRHRDEKTKEQSKTPKPKEKVKETKEKTPRSNREEPSSSKHSDNRRDNVDRKVHSDRRHHLHGNHTNNGSSSSQNRDENRKRPHSDKNSADDECNMMGPVCERPLSGVVFVLSGYQNPRRAMIRDLATSLGARARGDWGPGCTHLICAFSNTPKLATVRAGVGGRDVPAPQAEWVEECGRRGRLLPWRWFACEPSRRVTAPDLDPAPDPSPPHNAESDADTDDEIEKVLRQNKKARPSSPPPPAPARPSPPRHKLDDNDDDEVELVKDERMQGSVTVEDSDSCDTDVEEGGAGGGRSGVEGGGTLPALFEGQRFIVCEAAPVDARLLARYVRAYGGLVIEPEEAEEGGADCLVLCGGRGEGSAGGGGGEGRRVRADWVWACHDNCQLLPVHDYLVT